MLVRDACQYFLELFFIVLFVCFDTFCFGVDKYFFDVALLQQCSKLKKNPGCPYFKSRATKAVNLVALMNPWLPGRKTHTFKCTTQKNGLS